MASSRRRFLTGAAAFIGTGALTCRVPGAFGSSLIAPQAKAKHPLSGVARRSIQFGTAVRPEHLAAGTSVPGEILGRYDLLIPEYHTQWSAIAFEPGRNWFDNFDQIVSYARSHGIMVRGHALIWEQMTPSWIRSALGEPGGWDLVHKHFATMLTRHPDVVSEWVVINECVDTEGGVDGMRQTSFQRAFGNEYVERAFRLARTIAPDARLMLNEYGLEYDNPVDAAKRHALLRLVERLKSAGVPLDVVGLQAHLELSKGRLATKEIAAFCAELAGMDVDIAVTELDVMEADRNGMIEVRDERVADEARAYLEVLMDQPRLRSVSTWGLSDRDSWLQERSTSTKSAANSAPVDCVTMNRGLPYDGDFRPKPMVSAMTQAIRLAAC